MLTSKQSVDDSIIDFGFPAGDVKVAGSRHGNIGGGGMFANSGRRRHGDIKRRRKTTGQIGATITHREGELRMDSLGE